MRLLSLVALLLASTMAACSGSPTATLRQPGVDRADSNPPLLLSDTTNPVTRGPNGFGSGN